MMLITHGAYSRCFCLQLALPARYFELCGVRIKTVCLHPHGTPSGPNVYRAELSLEETHPFESCRADAKEGVNTLFLGHLLGSVSGF